MGSEETSHKGGDSISSTLGEAKQDVTGLCPQGYKEVILSQTKTYPQPGAQKEQLISKGEDTSQLNLQETVKSTYRNLGLLR